MTRRIPALLLLVFGSVAFALFALEIGVRLVTATDRNYLDEIVNAPPPDDTRRLNLAHLVRPDEDVRIVYKLRPNVVGRFLRKPVSINSLGIRGPERPLEKPAGTFRILGLGDSHMFGWGVGQGEAFLPVLEELLDEASDGPRFEAWNFAVPGYNTVQEARTLERWADRVKPDLVVVSYVDNDMHLPNFLRHRPNLWTVRRSYLVELVRRRWALLDGKRLEPLDLRVLGGSQQRPRDPEEIEEEFRPLYGWDNLETAYRRIGEIARARGIPVVLLFTGQDPPQKKAVVRLREIAAEEGFYVADPWTYIRKRARELDIPRSALAVSRSDPHASAITHRMIAEELHDVLTREELVPAGENRGALSPRRAESSR